MVCCKDPLVDLVQMCMHTCRGIVKGGPKNAFYFCYFQGEVKTVGRERWVLASGGRIMAVRSQVRDP